MALSHRILTEQLQPDLYVLSEPFFSDTERGGRVIPAGTPYADAYLLLGRDRAVLIDCLMSQLDVPITETIRGLTQLPVTVYFTHGHGDHVGRETASLLRAGWPLHLPEGELDLLLGMADRFGGIQAWMNAESFLPVRPGDVVELGEVSLETFCVPGHTPGHLCYLDRVGRRCFVGDAFGTLITGRSTLRSGSLAPFLEAVEAFERWVDDPDCMLYNGHRVNVGFCPWTVSVLREKRLEMAFRLEAGEELPPLSDAFRTAR